MLNEIDEFLNQITMDKEIAYDKYKNNSWWQCWIDNVGEKLAFNVYEWTYSCGLDPIDTNFKEFCDFLDGNGFIITYKDLEDGRCLISFKPIRANT